MRNTAYANLVNNKTKFSTAYHLHTKICFVFVFFVVFVKTIGCLCKILNKLQFSKHNNFENNLKHIYT